MLQDLFREVHAHSFYPFQSILPHILQRIHFRLSMNNWNKITSNELLSVSTKNLEMGFKAYNNQVKIKTDMGDRLIGAIENFKKEVLNIKRIEVDDMPRAVMKKRLRAIKEVNKEIAKREKIRKDRQGTKK